VNGLELTERRLPKLSLGFLPLEWVRSRRWARSLLLGAPVVALMLLFTVTGIRGVDFGFHWDEVGWQIQPVREMVSTGILLPHATIYPAFSKWLVLSAALPSGLQAALQMGINPRRIQAAMLAAIDAPNFLLTVRSVFIAFSSLSILWVYAAALALRRAWWEAVVAAACMALSWEFAYHARWVATDCVLVQFSALTLFMLALFHRARKPLWLYAAAIAAGLGSGAKFQGVLLLVPVIVSSLMISRHESTPFPELRRHARRLLALGVVAVAAYLITTPATLLEPFAFFEQLHFISAYYARGHYGHSVSSVWEHWRVVLTYFAIAYFSPWRVPAALLFASAVLGAILWIRSDRWTGVVFVCFPIAFLTFFCFNYLAVLVRNYLLIGPFLAFLAARGIAEVVDRLSRPWARWLLAAALAVLFVAQAAWLIRAGESIRHLDPNAYVREALGYVARHSDTRFLLSSRVRALAAAQHLTLPPNIADRADAQSLVFFAIAEGPSSPDWKTNDPWLAQGVFGPLEMNFDWYSGWSGHDRVVILSKAKAKATGAPLAR
jgi:Dolichyl-phosphate-mannose-protein mannosyltransferase